MQNGTLLSSQTQSEQLLTFLGHQGLVAGIHFDQEAWPKFDLGGLCSFALQEE